jgi:hypothetical protein
VDDPARAGERDLSVGRTLSRPVGTYGINGSSPFARYLRAWYPLTGNQLPVGPFRPVTPTVTVTQYPWAGTTRGVAFNGVGSTDRIITDASQFTDLNGLSDFSVGLRIFPRSGGGSEFGRAVVMTDGDVFSVGTSGSTGLFFVVNAINDTASSSITVGSWYDVVAVYRSGISKGLWINGVYFPLTTRTGTLTITTDTLVVGNRANGQRGFDGYITDVAIWTYALPAALGRAWHDPATRWDLYWQPGRTLYFDLGAAVTVRFRPQFRSVSFRRRCG